MSALRADKVALAQRAALSELDAAVQGRTARGVEDDILRLEAAAPGIGGIYVDANGRVNVFVRSNTNRGLAIAALRALGLRMNGALPEAARLIAGDVVVRTGGFAFSELVGWSQILIAEAVKVPGFVSIDADESSNRVVVTLADTTQRSEITRLAAIAGIPASAVQVRAGAPVVPLLDLRTETRPLAGGFEFRNGGGGRCSIGYDVTTPQGETGFLTAAHCSLGASGGGSTGETMYQLSTAVGTVAMNPAWTNGCYTTAGGGYFAGPCSEADVLFVSTSVSDAAKRLGMTSDVGINNARGSVSVVGHYNAFSSPVFAFVGVEAEKTGRTTGATRGNVQGTCESVLVRGSPNYIITCADRVTNAGAGSGDSGAPVYRQINSGIYPLGTLFAGGPLNAFDPQDGTSYCSSGCTYYYSPWTNIENRLARTFNPQP